MAVERIEGDKGFLFYYDDRVCFEVLEADEVKNLMFSLFDFAETGKVTVPNDSSPAFWMAFRMIAQHIERDKVKYAEISKKRAEAGSKGGNQTAENRKQSQANQANATFAEQTQANQANAPSVYQSEANQADKNREDKIRKDEDYLFDDVLNNNEGYVNNNNITKDSLADWSAFMKVVGGDFPASKMQNIDSCRDLLEMRIAETGLTVEEMGACIWRYVSNYREKNFEKSGWQYLKQLEDVLGADYDKELKPYVVERQMLNNSFEEEEPPFQ